MHILRLLSYTYANDDRVKDISPICNLCDDKTTFYMPSINDILKYRIVLTTLITAARIVNGGVPQGHYSYVIIDEAGYATETETLVAVAGILTQSNGKIGGQLVLAGDPRQLGPIIQSDYVKSFGFGMKNKDIDEYCLNIIFFVEKSMLERLIDTCDIYSRNEDNPTPYDHRFVTKLLKNYRSHETILKVPNELFYNNELVAVGNEYSNLFCNWDYLKSKNIPIIFHNVHGNDRREKILQGK